MAQYFAFQWHITDDCDQRCKHCYIFAEGHPALVTMNWEKIQHVFFNALEFCEKFGRLPYFYITGGDPILHPHFWDLLELCHEHKIPFTLMGNPFHLTPENLQRMRNLGCDKYQMSIDGMEKTHDWFRKPGSFKTTLQKIRLINEARGADGEAITSVIMTTLSGTNISEIPAVIDAVVEAGAAVYAFARYVPTSSGKSGEKSDWYISPDRYRDFLEKVDAKYQAYEKAGCKTYFNRKDHLWTLYDYENGKFNPKDYPDDEIVYGGCNCGNAHFTILSDGACYACRRMESKVGNALTDDLYDLFTGEKTDEYRVYEKFEKCAKCPLLRFCRGCPAVAFGYSGGNMYAPDPECWYEVK